MFSLLIAVIYLAFISLGLPDSLLGAAWPVMYEELGVPLSYAGVISMIITCGTILSSLSSDFLTRRFGAGRVTAASVLLTAVALFGFSVSPSFYLLCLFAIPYGVGAGAVDAALNNYVAVHYSSRHMSWLHCFWGVGVSLSPFIISSCLTSGLGWHAGYRTVSVIQFVLVAILLFSLPLWKKADGPDEKPDAHPRQGGIWHALRIPGVPCALLTFFGYCAAESTVGLWTSSYLVLARGVTEDRAAQLVSLFYLGITLGRFLNGFLADRFGDRTMTVSGIIVMAASLILIALPAGGSAAALPGLLCLGLGFAPIYPSLIHATPANFGEAHSQAVIGLQMASAYTGSTLMPPLFGLIANHVDIRWFPAFLAVFAVLLFAMVAWLSARGIFRGVKKKG